MLTKESPVLELPTSLAPELPRAVEAQREVAQPPAGQLGWLPVLCLSSACGLLLVALSYAGARASLAAVFTELLFWGGLLTLFTPVAVRLLGHDAARRERISLVLLFGLALYLVKVLRYPLSFAMHDEFLHWRTVNDILQSGRLFGDNPVLPISAHYPGLEIVTSALMELSGLSVFAASAVVLAAARVVLVLALYLFYERVAGSAWVAGMATLLYLMNPKLIFFDAQFSYESLALSLMALVMFALAERRIADQQALFGATAAAVLALGALAITHHLTAYALMAFLVLWSAVSIVGPRLATRREILSPTSITLLALVLNLTWLVYIATLVVDYFAPHVSGAVKELNQLVVGEAPRRELFRDYAGEVPPLWEREMALAATVLVVIGMPLGWLTLWQRYRSSVTALTLALAALAYPASLAFRFTTAGGEASDRAAGAVYMAIAFVLVIGVSRLLPQAATTARRIAIFASLASVIFVGNVIVGAGPAWARLPGPYLVSADARSVEPRGVEAAEWALTFLGPENRIATDRINRLLMVSYGRQRPITQARDGFDVSPLFFAPGYGTVQQAIVERGQIRYVVVDRRLTTALPRLGIYYEGPEPNALRHTAPVDPSALAKFDRLLDVSRVFDSGDMVIYQLGEATREP